MKLFDANRPFAPGRLPFFYGRVIVVVATLGVILSIPGQTMGVSVFTDHLLDHTGLTRLQLSTSYLIGTLGSSLFLPRGGRFLDHHGSRVTAVLACIGLSATLAFLSQVDRVAHFIATWLGLASAVPVAGVVLTLAFTALRFSGQGILTMASRTMLSKWFERRRGLTGGIAGFFISYGFASAPPIFQALIQLADWRSAWLLLAIVIGGGMSLVAWLFFRDNPEECGLRMDGDPAPEGPRSSEAGLRIDDEPSATREEALRTAGFWYVTAATSLQAMVYTGVTFHIVDIGNNAGIGGDAAVKLFFPIAIVSTTTGLLSGWAADRVPVRAIVLIFSAMQVLGFVGAGDLGSPVHVVAMIIGWGISGGLFGTIVSVAMPNFFGRKHLGAIASLQMSCMVAGSALGPAALAAAKDGLGSYQTGLWLCCVLGVGAFAFTALAPAPRPRA